MIDIENIVINTLSKHLSTEYPTASLSGEFVEVPENFPHVCITQDDNSVYTRTLDNDLEEHHANIMFTVNVYSNSLTGKKSECKKIAAAVDECMSAMRFTRTMMSPVPNVDRSIYRITMRYKAVAGRGVSIGDDTVFQIYRK